MPQRDDPRHNLRLTPALKGKLAHAAIDSGRSLNAEILARLEKSFAPDPAAHLAELFSQLAFLSDENRAKAVDHLVQAASMLVPGKTPKTTK